MKILVPVKRVLDPYVPVRLKQDGSGIVSKSLPHAMNPFDEVAMEEAVFQKATLPERITEIIAVSIGPQAVVDILRTALSMGGDRAIHIETDEDLEPLAIAKILKIVVEEEKPDLVLMGKQAVDHDNAQVGPMLAGLLGWPQACYASQLLLDAKQVPQDGFGSVGSGIARIILEPEPGEPIGLIVICEVEDGLASKALTLPALVTCDLRLNTPRPPGLANVMKAKRASIERQKLDDMAVDTTPRLEVIKTSAPAPKPACKILSDTAGLVDTFKQGDLL